MKTSKSFIIQLFNQMSSNKRRGHIPSHTNQRKGGGTGYAKQAPWFPRILIKLYNNFDRFFFYAFTSAHRKLLTLLTSLTVIIR